MNLAIGIVCLWIGFALLTVAFHQLPLESGHGAPSDVLRALQSKFAGLNSAYDY